MPVTSYSRTPASNNSAPPNGWPEGQSPSSVNNCARQLMTDIVNEAGKNAAKVLGSVAGTNTITAAMSPSLDAYAAGMMVILLPLNNNTGAATLNIDSLGALDILKENGAALVAGDIASGVPALLVLGSGADDFYLMNPQNAQSGTYTPTLTSVENVGSSTAFVCQYIRVGSVVTVSGRAEVDCTSGIGVTTRLGISLPVASDFASATQCGGAGQHFAQNVGISADATNNRAQAHWVSGSASAQDLYFTFTYLIV